MCDSVVMCWYCVFQENSQAKAVLFIQPVITNLIFTEGDLQSVQRSLRWDPSGKRKKFLFSGKEKCR